MKKKRTSSHNTDNGDLFDSAAGIEDLGHTPTSVEAEGAQDTQAGYLRRLFQKYILEKIPYQINAHNFSLELAVGFLIGTCPLLGTHTVAAMGLSFVFGMNYAVVLLGTLVSAPLLLLYLYPEKILGEWLLGQPPVDFRPVLALFEDARQHMGVDIWANMSAMIVLAENLGRTFTHILTGWVPMGIGTALSVYLSTRLMILVFRRKKELNRRNAITVTEERNERYLQNG